MLLAVVFHPSTLVCASLFWSSLLGNRTFLNWVTKTEVDIDCV